MIELIDTLNNIKSSQRVIAVVGLGISGVESAKLLCKIGLRVRCFEKQSRNQFQQKSKLHLQVFELEASGAEIKFGIDDASIEEHLHAVSLAVLSPGVALDSEVAQTIKAKGVPIISEFELGIVLTGRDSVVVTGSNGKSTTVTLIHEMLKRGGLQTELCGNIGMPVVSLVNENILEKGPDCNGYLVAEASSYQLELCSLIKPRVAMLLNLSANHLERHGSMEQYRRCKEQLFARQDGNDYALLPSGDRFVADIASRIRSQVCWIGETKPMLGQQGCYIRYEPSKEIDEIALLLSGAEELYWIARAKLLGLHNRYNIAFAICAARLLKVSQSVVQEAIDSFTPLEHRLEVYHGSNGLVVVNDSKSTTVASSIAAFDAVESAFPERKIVLMLGGLAKKGSWDPLFERLSGLQNRLETIVCFGKDGEMLSHCSDRVGLASKSYLTLAAGVEAAMQHAGEGTVLLLSPGCASFDEFTDFEHRGNVFKSLIAARLSAAA